MIKFRQLVDLSCFYALVLILIGVVAPGTGLAASLLQPSAATVSKAPDRLTKRQRLVSLDTSILAAQIHSSARDHDADRAAGSERLVGAVTVDLFDGQTVALRRSHVEAGQDGGVIWHASADGDGYGIFVLANNKLVGVIDFGARRYMIEPAGPQLHALREVDVAAYPADRHIDRPRLKRETRKTAPANARAVAPTIFNLLVAYTSRARTQMISGGSTLAQVIDLDIAITNQGMINSGIPVRVRRVGIVAVTSTYNEDLGTDAVKPLYDITSGTTANFPAIRALRTTRAADLVTLYMARTPISYCGVAWVTYPTPYEAYAFSSVHAQCRGSVTLAHELGHNFGLYHDRFVEPAAPASQYDFGYVNTSAIGNFRTIMSYSNKCYSVLGRDCQRITYYSTPLKLFGGKKVGIAKGTAGAADAARWINEKKLIISGFR